MPFTPEVKQLNVVRQGASNFIGVPEWVDVVVLVANTEAHYDLTALRTAMGPQFANTPLFVVFSADTGFWCNCHNTAAIPVASTTNGAAPMQSPNQLLIDGSVTTISLISPNAGIVALSIYRM